MASQLPPPSPLFLSLEVSHERIFSGLPWCPHQAIRFFLYNCLMKGFARGLLGARKQPFVSLFKGDSCEDFLVASLTPPPSPLPPS